jgi:hypothetical protein
MSRLQSVIYIIKIFIDVIKANMFCTAHFA